MSEQPKRTETVEEYLQRGGTITRLPDSPNSFYGVELDTPTTTKHQAEKTERNAKQLKGLKKKLKQK